MFSERILVVRTDRIGDLVLATPLLRALRQTFPHAYIAAMVRPSTRDVLLHNPNLNEILVDDFEGEHKGRKGFWNRLKMLRVRKFDTALLLLPTERAAWMLFLAGIPTRIGVGTKFYGVLTGMKSVSRNKYVPLRHEADYCLDLGRRIGVKSEELTTEIFLTEEEKEAGKGILSKARVAASDILVGIHPESGGSSPNWPMSRYVNLCEDLQKKLPEGVKLVITGLRPDADFPRSGRIVDLRGMLTLRQLMAVIDQLDCLFSASTGPMHIAAALKVPTVSIFCPLPACSPELWGPRGNEAEIILPPEGFCQGRCVRDPKRCQFEEVTTERAASVILNTVAKIRAEVSYP